LKIDQHLMRQVFGVPFWSTLYNSVSCQLFEAWVGKMSVFTGAVATTSSLSL